MGVQVNNNRTELEQIVATYTGNGGYQNNPNDNCSSIHLINLNEACDESRPSTIIEYLDKLS